MRPVTLDFASVMFCLPGVRAFEDLPRLPRPAVFGFAAGAPRRWPEGIWEENWRTLSTLMRRVLLRCCMDGRGALAVERVLFSRASVTWEIQLC